MSGPAIGIGGEGAALSGELLTLAFCWRLERRDGVAIGLTSHDRDLTVGTFPYRTAPGMVPSAIAAGSGLDPAGVEIAGAIDAGAIHADDLIAGRWDGAALWLHLTQWEAPGALWLELARGTLGAVAQQGERFAAELRGPAAVLERACVPATSAGCRAALGDMRCRVDLRARTHRAQVAGVEDAVVTLSGGAVPDGLAQGRLRWISGANAGLTSGIVGQDRAALILADAPPFAVEVGTRVEVQEGCDRRIVTCAMRFANAANFRGEPLLPGNDLLTRYPGAA